MRLEYKRIMDMKKKKKKCCEKTIFGGGRGNLELVGENGQHRKYRGRNYF